MSQSQIVVLTIFVAIFLQIWFSNFLKKVFVMMLRTRYESTYNSPALSFQQLIERASLLYEYLVILKVFFRKIFLVSLIVNAAIVATILMYLEK